jgi:hypothetical protein
MKMGWTEYVALLGGKEKCLQNFARVNVERYLLEVLAVNGRMLLKWILRNMMGGRGIY